MPEVPKTIRYESPQYLDYIRSLPCAKCGQSASPHHFRSVGSGGSDLDAVPLCLGCHTECHCIGFTTFQMKHDVSFYEVQRKILKAYVVKLEHLYIKGNR